MNTYNENLKTSIGTIMKALSAEQAKLTSMQIASHYNLYYAQGAEITALDAWQADEAAAAVCKAANDQSIKNDNIAYNLQASAAMANTDVTVSKTNIATAAANVQIASNAIAMLAADIGAALNNTIASLYGTDVYKQVSDANDFINNVANDSKHISYLTMDASRDTSEIITAAVLGQASGVKADMTTLLQTTQAEFDKFSNMATADDQAVGLAAQAEQQAEGAVSDIDSQIKANTATYNCTNTQLHLGLSVAVISGTNIDVTWERLPDQLFPALPASQINIPAADSAYYLTLLPQEQSATFSTDQAEQLFATWAADAAAAIKAAAAATDTIVFQTFYPLKFDVNTPSPAKVPMTQDAYGELIVPGNAYVAYIYIERSLAYKRFISNFSDILSPPSQPFVPATTLPLAQKILDTFSVIPSPLVSQVLGTLSLIPKQNDVTAPKPQAFKVAFSVTFSAKTPKLANLEYRCILIEQHLALGFMLSPELPSPSMSPSMPIFFNRNIALQVAPANCEKAILATLVSNSSSVTSPDTTTLPPSNSDTVEQYFGVDITASSTDNFGNMLKPGVYYQPMILTVATGIDANQYVSMLSGALAPLIIIPIPA